MPDEPWPWRTWLVDAATAVAHYGWSLVLALVRRTA